MSQMSFGDAEYAGKRKRTRREEFLAEMEKVVPWSVFEALIEPHYPKAGGGRRPYPLLERHDLAPKILEAVNADLSRKGLLLRRGTMVDATIIAAPSSTKNAEKARDPEMHQTKKGNQWHFGMKAHIGVDVESGLVHTVTTTAANAADVTQTEHLLHGSEEVVFADAGYTGAEHRVERKDISWYVAAKRGQVKAIANEAVREATQDLETLKARVRARVEHPFRVVKRQFGFVKVRFLGLTKNTAQILTLFALSNLWQARHRLLAMTGEVRPAFTG